MWVLAIAFQEFFIYPNQGSLKAAELDFKILFLLWWALGTGICYAIGKAGVSLQSVLALLNTLFLTCFVTHCALNCLPNISPAATSFGLRAVPVIIGAVAFGLGYRKYLSR